MEKKFSLNIVSVFGVAVLLVLLVGVRLFQDVLFYDPFIPFFKTDETILPPYDTTQLSLGLIFRYALNTVLSLGIIYLLFKDAGMIKLSAVLYLIFFAVLISAFFLVLTANDPNLLALFYIRRFLIQPLFLILFIPAFYYQRRG